MDPNAPLGALELTGLAMQAALGLFLVYLRFRVRPETTTRSLRWTLSIMSWLFLLNTGVYATQIGWVGGPSTPADVAPRLQDDLNAIVPFMLLSIGLFFPRPRGPPARLRIFALAIGAAAAATLGIVVGLHAIGSISRLGWSDVGVWTGYIRWFAHLAGWFVPLLFLWLPDYDVEPSEHSRLVLALLTWAFLFYPLVASIATTIFQLRGLRFIPFSYIWSVFLVVVFISLGWIIRSLWRRQGQWQLPEKVHLGFVGLVIVLGFGVSLAVPADASGGPPPLAWWLLLDFPWVVVRPLLFAAALLRFQVVTPDVPLDRGLALVGGVVSMVFVGSLIAGYGDPRDPVTLVLSLVLPIAAVYPVYRGLRRLAREFVPASRIAMGGRRQEARALYQLSLQSAVFGALVQDPDDERALAGMRLRLGVSDREHKLLLTGLGDRDAGRRRVGEIRNVFVMTPDGRLLCHIGPDSPEEADRDIVAGMLSAIRTFVAEGFQGKGELETVKFGDEVLAIEARGPLVIAAGVVGADLPEIRQTIGDWLALLDAKYGKVVTNWSGNMRDVEGIENDLRRLLRWSRVAGA